MQRRPCLDADEQFLMTLKENVLVFFGSLSGGVMTSQCGTRLDHGVLCVGYAKDGANIAGAVGQILHRIVCKSRQWWFEMHLLNCSCKGMRRLTTL